MHVIRVNRIRVNRLAFISQYHTPHMFIPYIMSCGTVEIYFYLKCPQMRIFYSVDFRPLDRFNLLGRSAFVINF